MARDMQVIWVGSELEYFYRKGWTRIDRFANALSDRAAGDKLGRMPAFLQPGLVLMPQKNP
jgi:hypothetical protein